MVTILFRSQCVRYSYPGIILGMGSANERRRYNVTSSLLGLAHTQNDSGYCVSGRRYYGPKKMVDILQSGNVLSPKYDFSCWQSYAFIEMGCSWYD